MFSSAYSPLSSWMPRSVLERPLPPVNPFAIGPNSSFFPPGTSPSLRKESALLRPSPLLPARSTVPFPPP